MSAGLLDTTKSILKKCNMKPKHGLGQNFLVDESVLERIIRSADIHPDTIVIEIGPGIGTLTQQLAKVSRKVLCIEIDPEMTGYLESAMKDFPNVVVIQEDFLKADIQTLYQEHRLPTSQGFQIVANLPYYITTPIIQKVIDERENLMDALFMVQKEVAERLAASPGTKIYGSLSIAVQYYMDVEIAFRVPKNSFFPIPKVDSAVIRLQKKAMPPVQVVNEKLFFDIVYGAFRQRRKTLLNNLKQCSFLDSIPPEILEEILQKVGVDKMRRGETLSIQEYAVLANEMDPIVKSGKKVQG